MSDTTKNYVRTQTNARGSSPTVGEGGSHMRLSTIHQITVPFAADHVRDIHTTVSKLYHFIDHESQAYTYY